MSGAAPAARLVSEMARLVWDRGWVANHDGNLSVRLGEDRFLATPTALSKRLVTEDDLVVVDLEGTVIEGSRRIFSEWRLHAAAYAVRPDVGAVVHAHPPHATAAGLTGLSLQHLPLPEAVVSLGRVPTARSLDPAEGPAEVQRLCARDDAILLPGNGVLAVGDDLEQAYLRLELVEHLCRILSAARAQGRVRPLPPGIEQAMLERRRAAGLGPEGRAARSEAPPQSARPERRAVAARAASVRGDALLAERITEEVLRHLRRS